MTTEILINNMKSLTESPYMHGLFWLIILDVFTGYLKAFKNKKFNSKVSTNGLLRHILVFFTMIIIGTYARSLGHQSVSIGVCFVFIGSYGSSVLENWVALGLPFKESWKVYFEQMKKSKVEKMQVDSMTVKQVDRHE